MQSTQRHEAASGPVVIRDPIGALGVGDVDLDHDQVGAIAGIGVKVLDMFVDDHRLVFGSQVGGQRGQTERRKQGVLDRAPIGAGGLGQRGKDQSDAKAARRCLHGHTLH